MFLKIQLSKTSVSDDSDLGLIRNPREGCGETPLPYASMTRLRPWQVNKCAQGMYYYNEASIHLVKHTLRGRTFITRITWHLGKGEM